MKYSPSIQRIIPFQKSSAEFYNFKDFFFSLICVLIKNSAEYIIFKMKRNYYMCIFRLLFSFQEIKYVLILPSIGEITKA